MRHRSFTPRPRVHQQETLQAHNEDLIHETHHNEEIPSPTAFPESNNEVKIETIFQNIQKMKLYFNLNY